jgi:AhpD family alkylhydroperoxidase
MRAIVLSSLTALLLAIPAVKSEETSETPRPTPQTRPEMKFLLEQMKARAPRILLPPLTEEEKTKLGEREASYESRLRSLYLGQSDFRFSGFGGRDPDSKMTLDNKFKVQLFWIVSRANNCQYCLGHQESKLLNAGMTEDEIAALDSAWDRFGEKEQVAFAFARKFTYEPYKLGDADIAGLKKHFTELQILEMILSMAGNNAINRWKEGVGVPQSSNGGGNLGRKEPEVPKKEAESAKKAHSYLTPTSDEYKDRISKVVALVNDANGKPTKQTVCNRPSTESREEVEKALEIARKRTPRLPLIEETAARELLGEEAPKGDLPQWVRLLGNFTVLGKSRILSQLSAEKKGDLSPLLKAQVSWIVARHDRAWYATGRAMKQLQDLGQNADQIFRLDGDWKDFTEKEKALFTVAKHLGASPVVLTDAEVALAVKLCGNRDVVQLVNFVTTMASFNRITEAAGLQLEK